MKKGRSITLKIVAVLLVLLLAAFGAVYFSVTAETAPELPQQGTKEVIAGMVNGVVTGEEVTVPVEAINGLVHRVSEEERKGLDGLEFVGPDRLSLWCEHKLLGRTCDVRLDAVLHFDSETGWVFCQVQGIHVGRLPLPESSIAPLIRREMEGASMRGVDVLEDGSISVDINGIVREELQIDTDTNVIRNVRCDADGLYITLYSAKDFLGDLFGKRP